MIVNDAVKLVALILSQQNWQMAIGTGTTPAWVDNKSLQYEQDREDCTQAIDTTDLGSDTVVFTGQFSLTGTLQISEYGIFQKASPQLMLCRLVQSPVTVQAGTPFRPIIRLQLKRA